MQTYVFELWTCLDSNDMVIALLMVSVGLLMGVVSHYRR